MAIYPPPSWNQPLPEWLSLQQAAALHGVSVDTLRRRIAAGRLPASRFGERLIRVRAEESRPSLPADSDRRLAARERTWPHGICATTCGTKSGRIRPAPPRDIGISRYPRGIVIFR